MRAVEFPQVTNRIAEHQEEFETLPVHAKVLGYVEGKPFVEITACFELNKEERDEFLRTGRIYYSQVIGINLMQPIRMSTQNPFEQDGQATT